MPPTREHVAGLEGEGGAGRDAAAPLTASANGAPNTTQPVRWSARSVGPRERDFQGRGVRRVADEGVAEGERGPVRRPAGRHPERPAAGPAPSTDQREAAPGSQDEQAHAKAFSVNPRASSAARTARANATASGLSPWTQTVRTPLVADQPLDLRRRLGRVVDEARPAPVRGTSEPSGR